MQADDAGAFILVVEDDGFARDAFAIAFRRQGLPARLVGSVREALVAIADAPPALAVLDAHLPDGSGATLAWQLRARWPGVPLILLTGDLRAAELAEAMAAEVCLLKPVALDDLLGTIRRLLASRGMAGAGDALMPPPPVEPDRH
jgi:two-component system nitrogen regulation response regulator GlnG